MKIWKALELLAENPNLQFKNNVNNNIIKINNKTKNLIWNNSNDTPFIIYNIDSLNIEWELIYERVDFMTAMNSGRKTRPISCNKDDFILGTNWLRYKTLSLDWINNEWELE